MSLFTAPCVDGRCLDTGTPYSGTRVEYFKLRVKRRLFQNCSGTLLVLLGIKTQNGLEKNYSCEFSW